MQAAAGPKRPLHPQTPSARAVRPPGPRAEVHRLRAAGRAISPLRRQAPEHMTTQSRCRAGSGRTAVHRVLPAPDLPPADPLRPGDPYRVC